MLSIESILWCSLIAAALAGASLASHRAVAAYAAGDIGQASEWFAPEGVAAGGTVGPGRLEVMLHLMTAREALAVDRLEARARRIEGDDQRTALVAFWS